MASQHIIELNGKRYDAVTGKMVTLASNSSAKTAAQTNKSNRVDGFARNAQAGGHPNTPAPGHKTEKSRTLMRKTVPKPSSKSNETMPETSLSHVKPHSMTTLSPHKLAHAQAVPRNALVRKFSEVSFSKKSPKAQPLAAGNPAQPHRLQAIATANVVQANPLAAALSKAESHVQPKPKGPKRHVRLAGRLKVSPGVVSGGAFVLAILLIGGFFTYQNIPNLSMRLAASRSGVRGTLPSYQPAGFGMKGGIAYQSGQIVLGFKSNSDGRNFEITQKNSTWNSEALRDNYLLASGRKYQVILDKGKTIYLYDGSNATWIDGGIWYRVEGNAQLNSAQLLSIANGL